MMKQTSIAEICLGVSCRLNHHLLMHRLVCMFIYIYIYLYIYIRTHTHIYIYTYILQVITYIRVQWLVLLHGTWKILNVSFISSRE